MSDFISRLFSTSSSKPEATPPSRVFCLRTSLYDSKHTVVHPMGYPVDVPPLYTIVSSKYTKPHIMLYRGTPHPANLIGEASFHSFSSTTELSIRGQHMRMKMNQLSGNFTIESPTAGKLKWHVSKITGHSMELRDTAELKLAFFKSSGFPGSGERKLEIFVQCDEPFVDLLILSGIAGRKLTSEANNAGAEIVGAVATT